MQNTIAQAIDRFYTKKDYEAFSAYCAKPLSLPEELQQYCETQGLKISSSNDDKYYPSRRWHIYFADYKKGEFEISYDTYFRISKVAPLFYIQHEFEVRNKGNNIMSPDLDGFSDQPYTKDQAAIHNEISTVMNKRGYLELKQIDIDEAVEGFKIPDGVTIFGHTVTVELLLFVDVLNICHE
jgi:hypothetical protein